MMRDRRDGRGGNADKEEKMDTLDTKWGAAWRSPQAQGGGYPPDGDHDVMVTRVVMSEITSRGEVCDPTFVFFLQAQNGLAFKTYQSIKSERALWRMRGILERLGLPIPDSPGKIIDSLRTLEGRCVHVRVRSRDYNGRTMHDVDFLAVVTQIQAPAAQPQAWTPAQIYAQQQPQGWTQQPPQAWTAAPAQAPQAWQQQSQPMPQPQAWPQQTPQALAQAQLDAAFPPQAPAPAPQALAQAQPITNAIQAPASPADVMGSDGWQAVPESAIPF